MSNFQYFKIWYFWPTYSDDPRALEWPQVLVFSVCLFIFPLVLEKFSKVKAYDIKKIERAPQNRPLPLVRKPIKKFSGHNKLYTWHHILTVLTSQHELIYIWVKLTISLHEIMTSLQMRQLQYIFIKNELYLLYLIQWIKPDTRSNGV